MFNLIDYPTLRLRPGGDRRVQSGHLWIFSNELMDGFQGCVPGSAVVVVDHRGKTAGTGLISPHSLIAVRLYSRDAIQFTPEFFRMRVRSANRLRESVLRSEIGSCRLIYAESDGLPGLIVDRFGSCLVLQSSTAGIDRHLPLIIPILEEEFSPSTIIAANDSPMRELEGLVLERKVLTGKLEEPVVFVEDGLSLCALPLSGQKTGFFHDQRNNRRALRSFVPRNSRVLDLFSYTGGFGLHALAAGAASVLFIDDSAPALEMARTGARLNGFEQQIETLDCDVFDWIKNAREMFDVVCMDPPALVKSRAKLDAALRAYRDLNARAIQRVKPYGILATSSCSGLVTWEAWKDALREAARKSARRLRFLCFAGQAPDHPILASMPETEYLKFAIAVVE